MAFFFSFFLGLYAKEEKFRRIEKKDTGIFNKTKRKYNLSWLVIFVVALLNFESTFPFGYFLSFFRTPTFLRLQKILHHITNVEKKIMNKTERIKK